MEVLEASEDTFPSSEIFLSASSPAVSSSSDYFCKACGQHATGYHYGVLACNACRAFFRRTVLYKNEDPYECSFNGNCVVIDKAGEVKNRITCSACRFRHCLSIGMLPNAVTKSNRRIGISAPASDIAVSNVRIEVRNIADDMILRSTRTISTSCLTEMYYMCRGYSENGVQIPFSDAYVIQNSWPTFVQAFHNVLQVEVMSMVEWVKRIPGFTDLYVEDQLTLLRAGARKHAYFRWVFQTASSNEKEISSILLREYVKAPVTGVEVKETDGVRPKYCAETFSRLKELVKPLRDWNTTEQEFLCFQALILLNPNVKGLHDRQKVLKLRQNIQLLIFNEQSVNQGFARRIMDLHLLLPSVEFVSHRSIRGITRINFFGVLSKVSRLLEDLIVHPSINELE